MIVCLSKLCFFYSFYTASVYFVWIDVIINVFLLYYIVWWIISIKWTACRICCEIWVLSSNYISIIIIFFSVVNRTFWHLKQLPYSNTQVETWLYSKTGICQVCRFNLKFSEILMQATVHMFSQCPTQTPQTAPRCTLHSKHTISQHSVWGEKRFTWPWQERFSFSVFTGSFLGEKNLLMCKKWCILFLRKQQHQFVLKQ